MRPVTFFVTQVGEHWEVKCSLREQKTPSCPDRGSALQAAQSHALAMWKDQRVATEVVVNEDDGSWHTVASYGAVLDF